MSSSDEEVLQFIAASFPSVWALELLLLLKREDRPCSQKELLGTLRASELVVSRALDALVSVGLASIETDGALYLPVNRDVEIYMDRVEQLYRTRPNAIRRTIIAARASGVTAFANAFKLRRNEDD